MYRTVRVGVWLSDCGHLAEVRNLQLKTTSVVTNSNNAKVPHPTCKVRYGVWVQ